MYESLYSRGDFNKRTIIGHNNNFPFYLVSDFEVRIERIPRMRGKLFHSQCYPLFGIIKVEYNDI